MKDLQNIKIKITTLSLERHNIDMEIKKLKQKQKTLEVKNGGIGNEKNNN